MKAAIVGLGKMGLLHASVLSIIPSVELAMVCEKSSLIRRFCKKIFEKSSVVEDLESLHRLDLDAVYVTTPIPSHFSITKTIYRDGIANNIFVEKSLASNYEEASELCELAKDKGGINMVGYMKRFSVTYGKARALLEKESIGEIVSFDAFAYSSDFYDVMDSRASISRGGVLKDLGAHVIDLATWYFGDLSVISASLDSRNGVGFEDSARIEVRTLEGKEGHFDVSWCKSEYRLPEFGLTIHGTDGSIQVNDDKVMLDLGDEKSNVWYRHDLADNVKFLLGAPEYYREDELFFESMLNGGAPQPDFLSASKVEQILDQSAKS